MQTFLPYPDFRLSAAILDNKRLGKQRLEVWQILNVLRGQTAGWRNHPAVLMWRGHEGALVEYGVFCCNEWRRRGFKDTLLEKITSVKIRNVNSRAKPDWFGRESFHASHRSNLLRKDPIHYGQFGWREPPDLPYVWPTKERPSE